MSVSTVLQAFKNGELTEEQAIERIQDGLLENLGHTVVDHNRADRTGAAEVIFGEGKSAAQIEDIISAMTDHGSNVLVTRLDADKYGQMNQLPDAATYHETSRLLTITHTSPPAVATHIGVVSAGTSDMAVAEEAALTVEFYGNEVQRIYDVGVAGLHRLLARVDDLRAARVLVVVAGMEGALPSVVGGLVDKPVIAVPTSVGYGAAFDGLAATLGMLTSCASGVSVVNINNGFGAGYLANTINRL